MGRTKRVVLALGILALVGLVGADVARQYFSSATEQSYREQHGDFVPNFKVGEMAPEFSLPDRSGQELTLSSVVKGDTLLCFLCGCDRCREMQINLGVMLRSIKTKPAIVSVTTAPVESEDSWKRDTSVEQVMLYDAKEAGKPVTKQYRADPCPRVFRLAADRKISWIGPSPAQVSTMDEYGEALARNLGYRRKGASTSERGTRETGQARPHSH